MSNASRWGRTARLISTHCGVLGARVSEAIADFDPETATDAERDRLAATLRETAHVLAQARAAFDQERADMANLRALVANDEKAAARLAARLAAGTISQATVTLFRNALAANKARLPQQMHEAGDVRGDLDALQKIIDGAQQP